MFKSMRVLLLICFLTAFSSTAHGQSDNSEDILGKILNEVGFDWTDLGYQSKGYWNRFPLDIPHKLGSFDDLWAEPMKLYD